LCRSTAGGPLPPPLPPRGPGRCPHPTAPPSAGTPVPRDTPSSQGSSGHCQPRGARGTAGCCPLPAPSEAWGNAQPQPPKSRGGGAAVLAGRRRAAGRPPRAAGCSVPPLAPLAGLSRGAPGRTPRSRWHQLLGTEQGGGSAAHPSITVPSRLGPFWPRKTGGHPPLCRTLPLSQGLPERVEPRLGWQPPPQPMQLHSAAESFSTVCHVFCTSMKETAS